MFKTLKSKLLAGSAVVASAVSGVVSAAIPVAASTAITDLQTDALGMIDLFWPVIGAITVGFILIKLFKRGGSKV